MFAESKNNAIFAIWDAQCKLCIFGRLAQLVQSTSFTPRGSGVRTPHRPQKTSTEMLEFFLFNYNLGSLTQLVQSVTSTTWKSLVRIQYGPQSTSK